jgi:hypothetical protein
VPSNDSSEFDILCKMMHLCRESVGVWALVLPFEFGIGFVLEDPCVLCRWRFALELWPLNCISRKFVLLICNAAVGQ